MSFWIQKQCASLSSQGGYSNTPLHAFPLSQALVKALSISILLPGPKVMRRALLPKNHVWNTVSIASSNLAQNVFVCSVSLHAAKRKTRTRKNTLFQCLRNAVTGLGSYSDIFETFTLSSMHSFSQQHWRAMHHMKALDSALKPQHCTHRVISPDGGPDISPTRKTAVVPIFFYLRVCHRHE